MKKLNLPRILISWVLSAICRFTPFSGISIETATPLLEVPFQHQSQRWTTIYFSVTRLDICNRGDFSEIQKAFLYCCRKFGYKCTQYSVIGNKYCGLRIRLVIQERKEISCEDWI